MSDYYYKEFCPKCNTKNWFTGSHYDGDDSKSDPSPIHICFKCCHFYISPDDNLTIEEICEAADHNLWDDVNGDITSFIAQHGDYDIGKETIE